MPYQGHDGRSPGEIWVKTTNGWRTSRTISIRRNSMEQHNQLQAFNQIDAKENSEEESRYKGFLWQTRAPYIVLPGCPNRGPSFYFVIKRGSRQTGTYSTVREAFRALEFNRAAKDSRKFKYVCKIVELIIQNQHITPEYGSAQKQVQLTLTEIVQTALDSECNIHVAKHVVNAAREKLIHDKLKYIGMQQAFEKRLYELVDLLGKLKRFKVKKLKKGITKTSTKMTYLPDECLRMIISCFSDHRDVCRMARVNRQLNRLCNESQIWKGLCKFHLTKQQLEKISVEAYPNWKDWYKKLMKQSLMREVYADMLHLCSHCHCMFWTGANHPCTYDIDNKDHQLPVFIPVTPLGFFQLFEG